jgi:shikimate kinase/shikimate kinase/3-dehydroquinate synthase
LKKNLVLTGMMGVGKSTIGRMLAKKLKLKFIDIDRLIEKKQNSVINEIFEKKGENYFRKIEKQISLEELKKDGLVIALGGGAFVDPIIRKEVSNTSISFWLDLNPKILVTRLKNAKMRPLLKQGNLEQKINKIYSQRKKIYSESDFKIKCDSLKVEELVNRIIELYEDARDKS